MRLILLFTLLVPLWSCSNNILLDEPDARIETSGWTDVQPRLDTNSDIKDSIISDTHDIHDTGGMDTGNDMADTHEDRDPGSPDIPRDNGPNDTGSNPCEGVYCSGHGHCVESYGSPSCVCDTGYKAQGLKCVKNTPPGKTRVLFDAGHGVTAGNADWRIDNNSPRPQPESPHDEEDWDGAISRWAFEMYKTKNYEIYNSTSHFTITYGNYGDLDLKNFDIFISCEPNTPYSKPEKTALMKFISNGGRFILIIDHAGSDRNNDGWDSPEIADDFFTNNSVETNPFGITIPQTEKGLGANISGKLKSVNSSSVIIQGPYGRVNQVNFHNGTYFSLNSSKGGQALVWYGYSQSSTKVVAAVVPYENGWFALVGDSSPVDDGTGDSSDKLYDGWDEADDGSFLMNLTDFMRNN